MHFVVKLNVPPKKPAEISGYTEMDAEMREMALAHKQVKVANTYEVTDGGENVFDFELNDLSQR